jgi:beta-galactosidase
VSEDGLKELSALVRLARNHPSVFLYSLYNEEPWQGETRGKRIAEKLRKTILALDPTRAVTGAQNADATVEGNALDCLDVIGLNYNLARYKEVYNRQKEKVILGTENSPVFATRGCKTSDRNAQIFADDGYEYPKDFAEPLQETMQAVEENSFVAGCFVWCGFDHRGEPNPYGYPSVWSHWGFLDNCGFEKNISYWLKAYYTDEPFVKLTTGQVLNEGKRVLRAFTNCDSAKLYANGKELCASKVENHRAEWVVPVESVEFKVVATKGESCVVDELRRAGVFHRLEIETVGGGQSGIEIYNVSAVDERGEFIETENGLVEIDASDSEILGLENGNPNYHGADKGQSIPLFNGRAQVIVKKGENGIAFRYQK